ncbi:hypothetical protein EDF56_11613 [Novosphingobium sp. PhB165]|uniref:hypothetical protein n=1 Tax=Novosphingobium sp. PhB165 TaxID=2485105 RepID=UPI0010EEBFA4|nr:hypothetical protein [Novosphingobium sp. PhB165]TCM12989.1 hypothetical protein EDF56_11613 [Novosphingobium sp. PhB165]
MNIYTLRFLKAGDEAALSEDHEEQLEFQAADVVGALVIAHEKASRRSAELWDEARRLCTIHRSPGAGFSMRAARA